ncbi:MAG: NAD-dependent epimerase/dehydratase family protein [Actinomycetota bacterium]|nr:NAD-dependent epimerase/dehydratase family protein [Rubrobacteraceae bacterium]MDQ5810225.1 NAD-dependent epimerase/dehydratase family protein [Actinomycetota bacterium]MDQ5830416.1 NAD-dependent epimerase/dehydratase family protein [Actinomycetota bacterium]
MNWLITGGCGFLGTAFVRSLVEEGGHAVRVVDDLSVGEREDLEAVCRYVERAPEDLEAFPASGEPVELVVGDILDERLALRAAEGADVIVHLAANTGVAPSVEDPRRDCMSNVLGTFNYLEAARHGGVRRFVFASSGAAVGEVEPPLHEELAPHPVSPYGASKLAGEGYCSAYFRTFGIETVALRFGNVYGPLSGHKNSAVAKFIKRAMRGEVLEIYGDGTQTRDFIYIDDLIRAVRLSATVDGVGGEVFQIATNAETSVQELVDKLLPALAAAGIVDVEVREAAPRLGDVMRNYSDTSKAARMLGWRTEVDLDEGLRRTVEWFTGSPDPRGR